MILSRRWKGDCRNDGQSSSSSSKESRRKDLDSGTQNDRERSVYIEGRRRRAIGQDKVNIGSQPILSSVLLLCVFFIFHSSLSSSITGDNMWISSSSSIYFKIYSVQYIYTIKSFGNKKIYPSTLCSFTIKGWRGAGAWAQDRLMASSNWIKSKWCITYGSIARRYSTPLHMVCCLYRTTRSKLADDAMTCRVYMMRWNIYWLICISNFRIRLYILTSLSLLYT